MRSSGAIVAVVVALLVAGCGGEPRRSASGAEPASAAPAVSAAEARALGLTWRLPARYRRVCTEQAAYAPEGARSCPPLVPTGAMRVDWADPFSPLPRWAAGYTADLGSGSLDELRGRRIDSNGGHWRYDVAWSAAVRRLVVDRGVRRPVDAEAASSCRPVRLGGYRVQACEVPPYEQGGGINGDHVAYVWRHERTAFVLSLHGYRNEPRARAMMAAWMAEVLR